MPASVRAGQSCCREHRHFRDLQVGPDVRFCALAGRNRLIRIDCKP
ncbi:MAG: hypothetical protein ACK5HY_04750 [Parahaliea sp.]